MAKIITEPESSHVIHHYDEDNSSSGSWVALASLALIIVLALLFFYFVLPLLNRPVVPEVNVPGQIDVNLNQR